MNLFVLISTIDEGIERVPRMLLHPCNNVYYVVAWERTTSTVTDQEPEALQRSDVRCIVMEGKGLCRSRNRCMDEAWTWQKRLGLVAAETVWLLSDDDEVYKADAPKKILDFFASNPETDVALWRLRDHDGGRLKRYPFGLTHYANHPRWYYPSSCEMTMRSTVYETEVRFDERFGLGSDELCAGEEEVWLYDVYKTGCRIEIVPETIAATEANTTGRDVLNVKVLRSKGAVYARTMWRGMAYLRAVHEAFSLNRHYGAPIWSTLKTICEGMKI